MNRIGAGMPPVPPSATPPRKDDWAESGPAFLDHLVQAAATAGDTVVPATGGLPAGATSTAGPSTLDAPLSGVPRVPPSGYMVGGQDPNAIAFAGTQAALAADGAVTPVRLLAQHWYGNGYLSLAGQGPAVVAAPQQRQGGGHDVATRASGEGAAGVPAIARPATQATASQAPWPVWLECPPDPARGEDVAALERLARSLGPALAADQPWPERMLRTIVRPDGLVTVWVRDYAMASGDVPGLVAHLLHQASLHGATLDRVVVNGATVWRHPSIQGDG